MKEGRVLTQILEFRVLRTMCYNYFLIHFFVGILHLYLFEWSETPDIISDKY